MRFVFSLFLVSFALSTFVAIARPVAVSVPFEGTYIGYIHMDGADAKIPTTLENIKLTAYKLAKSSLVSMMKLSFGGFVSHEYITQFYYLSDYRWMDDEISLLGTKRGNGPDVSLYDGLVKEEGQRIVGGISSAKSGKLTGKFEVVYYKGKESVTLLDGIFPEVKKVMKPISGDYEGACYNEALMETVTAIQLEAIKLDHSWEESNSALTGYNVYGRVARPLYEFEKESYKKGTKIVHRAFNDASYNFYTRKLQIPSIMLRCDVTNDFLDCGKRCRFRRVIPKKASQSVNHLFVKKEFIRPKNKVNLGVNEQKSFEFPLKDAQIEGKYSGLLHLEGRDVYETIDGEVFLGGAPDDESKNGLKQPDVGMTGKIYVAGDVDSSQNLAFNYQPARFPKIEFNSLVLFGNEMHKESFLKVHRWNANGMSGVLYSRSYGRVGEFEMLFKPDKADIERITKLDLFPKPLEGSYFNGTRHKNGLIDGTQYSVVVSPPKKDDEDLGRVPSYFPFTVGGIGLDFVTQKVEPRRRSSVSDAWMARMYPDIGKDIKLLRALEKNYPGYKRVGDMAMHTFLSPAYRGAYDPFTGNLGLVLPQKGIFVAKLLPRDGIKGYLRGGSRAFVQLRPTELIHYKRTQ